MANLSAGGLGTAAAEIPVFESSTGFTVCGETIEDAVMTRSIHPVDRVERLDRGGDGKLGLLRVWLESRKSASVLAVLGNGRGLPLAALAGYIGHVVLREGVVQTISYIPISPRHAEAKKPWRWNFYLANRERLERLRALAAASVGKRAFRIGDPERAGRLAEVLRDAKEIDPVLGLYATYAYLETGNEEAIASVQSHGRGSRSAALRRCDACEIARTWTQLRSSPRPLLSDPDAGLELPPEPADGADRYPRGRAGRTDRRPLDDVRTERTKTLTEAISRGELDGE